MQPTPTGRPARPRAVVCTTLFALACAGGVSCKSTSKPAAPPADATRQGQIAKLPGTSPAPSKLPWIVDDYAKARATARADKKPLLIDMWAGWCHTCLSMRHVVLPEKRLRPHLDRFVLLEMDTEQARNAPALKRFPVKGWPTFFVVDPEDETVAARHVGAASANQLIGFLDAAQKVLASKAAAGEDPLLLARDGDRLATRGDFKGADRAYARALAAAPADWPRRPDVLVAQISARYRAERWRDCAALGAARHGDTGTTASAADFLAYAVECAKRLKPRDRQRVKLLETAAESIGALLMSPQAALTIDDRADALRILRGVHEALGNKEEAQRAAESQRAMLDSAAEEASTPEEAAIHNGPRADVYIYLGKGAELIPALRASEKALPKAYDPPYRLAQVLLSLGRHDEALAAATAAVALAYGPRKYRVQSLVADVHRARKDRAAERTAREQALTILTALPEGQRNPSAEAEAKKALAAAGR